MQPPGSTATPVQCARAYAGLEVMQEISLSDLRTGTVGLGALWDGATPSRFTVPTIMLHRCNSTRASRWTRPRWRRSSSQASAQPTTLVLSPKAVRAGRLGTRFGHGELG
jgi:hypothetical protein